MPNAHLDTLSNRHAKLDAQIDAERVRPQPDTLLIARLKKEKLRVKQELQRPH